MIRKSGRAFVSMLLVVSWLAHRAQTFPSSVVTSLVGPHTLFLDEYADPIRPKIRATIFFTDFSESSWQFALRLKITGPNSILITTKPGHRPLTPEIISPGTPYVLEGSDLAYYFDYDNLDFSGISRSQLQINNRLPEGLYTFCFEAVDYESGKPLSHAGCATAWLSLNDPPLITAPVFGAVVENISMQNILFQWQLTNATGNLDMQQLSYKLELYEVNNGWTNPATAIMNNQALPIWQSQPVQQLSLLYGLAEPPLEKGKRYAFTVKAIESSGRCSFKNNGYSAPSFFHFGYLENDTIECVSPDDEFQFALSTPSIFKWKRPSRALGSQLVAYTLKIVEVNNNQDPADALMYNNAFFQQTYLPTTNQQLEKTVPTTTWTGIRRMGHYAWQVYGQSGSQQVAKSEIREFTGPPAIEEFIAGGFLMKVTRLSYYDEQQHIISGRCKTLLNNAWNAGETEFGFSNIQLSAIGNNEWVMSGGMIADRISTPDYTLQPMDQPVNGPAYFKPDSIIVNTSDVKLSGRIEWLFPHPGINGAREKITSALCRLSLANSSYFLAASYPINPQANYSIDLLEPFGFQFIVGQSSSMTVYQSKYSWSFTGFVRTPVSVSGLQGSPPRFYYNGSTQLHYFTQERNTNSESIRLARNTSFGLMPLRYTVDLSERQSPPELGTDSAWKGVYISEARMELPTTAESSGQFSLSAAKNFTFQNAQNDTVIAHISPSGLELNCWTAFSLADSVKFNGFASKQATFTVKIHESEIARAAIRGAIYIPVLDTLNAFPYRMDLDADGFSEGYLLAALANTSYTFNPSGSAEQKVRFTVKRAIFKGRNRLEMDLDVSWPHFGLNIPGVKNFCAWGNNNIGFDVPNGKSPLTYQSAGSLSGFSMTVDYVGCGRSGNAYAFGASAKITMDDEIAGETGPPVVNAYSIYRNSLLTGMVYVPPVTTVALNSGSTTANNTVTSTYQSATGNYTGAITAGVGEGLGNLGFSPKDTMNVANPYSQSAQQTMVNGNIIMKLKDAVDLVYKLKPYISSKYVSDVEWQVLDRFKNALNDNTLQQEQLTNVRSLINYVLNRAVEGVVARLNDAIVSISNKAVSKIRTGINTLIVSPVNARIGSSLGMVFDRMQQQTLGMVDEQYHQQVIATYSIVRGAVTNAIKNSVMLSVEKNVTSRLTGVVELGVTAKITAFVRKEVTYAANQLITSGVHANINLPNLVNNGAQLFAGIADTVKSALVNTNSVTIINTARSLVDDAINGIDWNAVAAQITSELVGKGLGQTVASQVSQLFSESVGPYAAAVLSTVKFDFSNLGAKLQNGQFNKVVKFDPTTIYIESPAVDVRGQLLFTKADPTFGDSWQGNIFARVKIPKRDNPIECDAVFVNGKTSPGAGSFTYWFVKLAAAGLNIPLTPAPFVWDGAQGFAFSRMKRTGETTIVPYQPTKFGVACSFRFIDQQSSGHSYIFDLGADAVFNTGGFTAELNGDASLLNYQKQNGKYKSPGFITGTGTLGYYKTPELSKVAGNFNVTFHTSPVFCAGGEVGLDLRSPSDWRVWVGTQQNPVFSKIFCKDWLSNTAYMEVNNNGMQAGLGMNVAISAKSPWIQFTNVRVRGFANLALGYNAYTSIDWDPAFKINEATISAWLNANIGIDYQSGTVSNSLTLAGVSLAGTLSYKSQPDAEIHGEMEGSITVIGYELDFHLPVNYSLTRQEILD